MITCAVPLAFVVVVGTIVALAATGNLLSSSPIVIGVQVGALALSVWSRRSFQKGTFRVSATPGGSSLIRYGPYRLVRHPMYSAVPLFIWAAVVSHVSPLTLALGIGATAIVMARVVVEERLHRAEFPE